jgi:hypothetical protein
MISSNRLLAEGLRVRLVKPINTVLSGYWPHKVTLQVGRNVWDTLDQVLAGTEGTVYRFRIRRGLPTCGLPHAEMWGVAWDNVPPPLSGHFGLMSEKLIPDDMVEAHQQQASELVTLRIAWLEALARRKSKEEVFAKHHREKNDHEVLPREHYDEFHALQADAEAKQKAYDEAAHIPLRKV